MKLRCAAARAAAVLAVTLSFAQAPRGVRVTLDEESKPAAKTPAGKPDAPKPAAKADARKAEKKSDEPGKIEGVEIRRGDGYLGLQLVGGTFKLSFYDAKKKSVAPDVVRANLTWKVRYQPNPEKAVLLPNGNALTSPKVVKPPFAFNVTVTLIKSEAADAPVENFSVDFRA